MLGRLIDLGNPVASHPLNRGLVSWWMGLPGVALGDTLRDIAGRKHAAMQGTLGPRQWEGGFSGIWPEEVNGDYANAGQDALFNTGTFTAAAWVRRDKSMGGDSGLMGKGVTGSACWYFYFPGGGSGIRFLGDSPASWTAGNWTVPIHAWSLVVGTHDGANGRLYGNGVLQATSGSSSVATTGADLFVGGRDNGGGDIRTFPGQVGSAWFWGRALSDGEVAALYDECRYGFPSMLRRYSRRAWLFAGSAGGATNYTLTAAAGSFAVTGQAATLKAARLLTAAAGSYTVSGQAATLKVGRLLTAAAGTYTVSGQDATLKATRLLTAAAGSFTVSGQDAALKAARLLTAAAGSYVVTGQDATLRPARLLTAAAGSFAVSGQDATLKAARLLTAAAGSYTVSGQAATLKAARLLSAATGTYIVSGQDASLHKGLTLTASAGSFAVTGSDATLTRTRVLVCGAGSFTVTGASATLTADVDATVPAGRVYRGQGRGSFGAGGGRTYRGQSRG